MPAAPKAPVAASPEPKTAAKGKHRITAGSTANPAEKAGNASTAAKKLTPATPESEMPESAKRKRLSKAFPRPLDKIQKKIRLVRDSFTIPENEYEQLGLLKKRLAAQGIGVKKGQLLRAGLRLLAAMDDTELKAAAEKLSIARGGEQKE